MSLCYICQQARDRHGNTEERLCQMEAQLEEKNEELQCVCEHADVSTELVPRDRQESQCSFLCFCRFWSTPHSCCVCLVCSRICELSAVRCVHHTHNFMSTLVAQKDVGACGLCCKGRWVPTSKEAACCFDLPVRYKRDLIGVHQTNQRCWLGVHLKLE